MSFAPIHELLDEIRAGRMVVIVDDEDRENEGDLIMAAELVQPQDINFMVTHARGLVCLSLTRERCRQLGLPPMVRNNTSVHGTNFTVSIEAAEGVTTGISAHDRAHTVRTAVRRDAGPADLSQPGHIFPLQAQPGGVLHRSGHTEAAGDLASLAGLEPAGVLVEILNPDGSMARRPELEAFAQAHGLKIGSIEELIRYRLATENAVERGDEREIEAANAGAAKLDGPSRSLTMAHHEGDLRATEGARFAILASRWNPSITDALVAGARNAFAEHGVADAAVDVVRVPGAWELPLAAARIAAAGGHVAVVALGCVVRGDTRHYEQVADGCAQGLMRVALDYSLPVCNGVLAVENHADAAKRAGGVHGNKGEEAALVAIEMSQLLQHLPQHTRGQA